MEQEDTPMAEMLMIFPHESAVVMQRGIELGIVCSFFLVMHCTWLVCSNWLSDQYPDTLLRAFCLVRILCAVPRPYFWLRTRRLFMEARHQPTPQLVSKSLRDILAHPFITERGFFLFYYGWLVCIGSWVLGMSMEAEPTQFVLQLWRHIMFNFFSIAVHRIFCILLFYFLVQSDLERGILPDMLEKYTKKFVVSNGDDKISQICTDDAECSICLGSYVDGEEVRQLSCQHLFHRCCVDAWLLRHQNRCPLCLHIVGPQN